MMLLDGSTTESTARDCHQILSKALKRTVILAVADRGWMSGVHATLPPTWTGKAEQYWLDMDGLDHRNTVTDFSLPRGTFFDGAIIHLITTATGILRTVMQQNEGNVGVYAKVVQGGAITRGDRLKAIA